MEITIWTRRFSPVLPSGGQKENADERFEQFFHDAGMTLLDDEVRLIENHFYLVGRKDPARCKN